MPPAANDNQGLKIATALLAALSVVLAVATYFGFAGASANWERFEQTNKDLGTAKQAANDLQNRLNEIKAVAGYEKASDADLKKTIDADHEKLVSAVTGINQEVANVYETFRNAAGQQVPQAVDEFANASKTAAERISTSPDKSMLASITGMAELLRNNSKLLGAMAADYASTRKELEAMNQVNKSKVDLVEQDKATTQADRLAELQKHDEDRKSLMAQLTSLQEKVQELATQLTEKENLLASTIQTKDDRYNKLMRSFITQREKLEQKETVLESPNGFLTFVDYKSGTVRTSLTRRQGAKEQLVFSVFDKNAPGIPSEKVKGSIELTRVDDNGSSGRIVKTTETTAPLSAGDQLYSPAFGAQPREFALIGKIDIDRNGFDDRADLKRMIESRGGKVVYDLPPPGVGVESGVLTPSCSYYVIDNSKPIRAGVEEKAGATDAEEQAFAQKKTKALEEARLSGVRAISLERLLRMLNYSYGEAKPGMPEVFDRKMYDKLTKPIGGAPPTPPAASSGGAAIRVDGGRASR
jgi:hypothetical protein